MAKLPIFSFLDKSLQQLQTQWSNVLNPVVSRVSQFNTLSPTQQSFQNQSGIYKTPSGIFYLNILLSATSGTTVFGTGYLAATVNSVTIPKPLNPTAFFFVANNYLDVVIPSPQTSYAYAVPSSGYIVVREYYQ